MKKTKYSLLLLIFTASLNLPVLAQPFIQEIKAFRSADSLHAPEGKPILMIGSSSFTKWKDVNEYFPGKNLLNRGFGGSSITDLLFYADDILLKYQPRQVLIYCGENDFAGSDTIQTNTVYQRFLRLYQIIRHKFPKVPVAYISMKPSPSRTHLLPKFREANDKIRRFMATEKRGQFIDVYQPMLNVDGSFKSEIYLKDSLHMNAKGYEIWKGVLLQYLK